MATPRNHPFTGCMTALVTPFKNGKVDDAALAKLVEWQIEQGIDAIVSVGTTGESGHAGAGDVLWGIHLDTKKIAYQGTDGSVGFNRAFALLRDGRLLFNGADAAFDIHYVDKSGAEIPSAQAIAEAEKLMTKPGTKPAAKP